METIFYSNNINFVKISEDLINDYLEMLNDVEGVARYIGPTTRIYSYEKELAFVRGKLEANAAIFSMIEKSSGDFIGNIEFMNVDNGCGELGIVITAKKQNMNYGTEAIRRMIEYGFESLGLKRIILKVYPDNARAIHVYEKCSFVQYDIVDGDICMEIVK